ncbi:MAG TPA: alpha/beta hydrolase [Thermoanaerobaculia bacterium]|nr:alpha/beta hydrolase [Thermoanaerobaculia bacterium]
MAGKPELVEGLLERVAGISRPQAEAIVAALGEAVAQALGRGERVQLPGLGTLSRVTSAARLGRNPRTGESLAIAATPRVRFTTSRDLKVMLNLPWRRSLGMAVTARRAPAFRLRPPSKPTHTVQTVFYATDRKPTGDKKRPARFYGGDRAAELTFGTCEVSIPIDHQLGHLEGPTWMKLEFRAHPEKHVLLLAVKPWEPQAWRQEVAAKSGAGGGEALVFIHGFRTTFADAARRTAQLHYDLQFKGPSILYSWPSAGRAKAYLYDGNSAQYTKPHLRAFLDGLRTIPGLARIHVVAHSMGNRALVEVLSEAAPPTDAAPQLNQVILAAPDIDCDVFRALATRLRPQAERTTLYASTGDTALEWSRRVNLKPRAGDAGEHLVVVDGIDTVDASLVDTDLGSTHSNFAENRSVIADIFYVVTQRLRPDQRAHLRPRASAAGAYWEFVR